MPKEKRLSGYFNDVRGWYSKIKLAFHQGSDHANVTLPKTASQQQYRRVIKCPSKHARSHHSSRNSPIEAESDAPCYVDEWYSGVFGNKDPFWHPELLKLAEKYIKHTIKSDNGKVHLKNGVRDYISSLILRCGFRAKLKHIHRDINDVIKVLRVSSRVHSALGLDARHGFSVFNGMCFNGYMAYPRMECQIDRCDVLLAESFIPNHNEDNSCHYEEMHDVCDALDSVDMHIERLHRSGVKLLLCSSAVSSDIGKQLYLRGISCVCKVDRDILRQLGVALDCKIAERLDQTPDYEDYISTIHKFSMDINGTETVVALSLDPGFHGCTILYSKCHVTRVNADHMRELLRTALFRLQGLFEELTFVKDLGGRLRVDNSPILLMDTFRSMMVSCRTSVSPDVAGHNSVVQPSNLDSPVPFHFNATDSLLCSERRYSLEINTRKKVAHDAKSCAISTKRTRVNFLPRSVMPTAQSHLNSLHFADWLKSYLAGASEPTAPSSSLSSTTTFTELQESSVLSCLQYYTKHSEICGLATRKTFPITRYAEGCFLSDFLFEYGRCLHRNRCMSSNGCSENLSRHYMHLETTNSSLSIRPKRLTLAVDNGEGRTGSVNFDTPYAIGMRCRVCGNPDMVAVHDLTFGRFLQMVLYDSYYMAKCGHSLFGNHAFSIHSDTFTIHLRVQDISNYEVGVQFNAPLINCSLGVLPLFSAGVSVLDRKLLHVSSKLSKILENFYDVVTENTTEARDDIPLELPNSAETSDSVKNDWDPHATYDFELLYLKDRSSTLSMSLRNLLRMTTVYIDSRFPEFIASDRLEEILPCRCEFSCTMGGGVYLEHLDPRNHWTIPIFPKSLKEFIEAFEDRNAFGVELHPQLFETISATITRPKSFGFCGRCNQVNYTSIAEIEILNWLYIITGVTKSIGRKLNSLSVTLTETVKQYSDDLEKLSSQGKHSEKDVYHSASSVDITPTNAVPKGNSKGPTSDGTPDGVDIVGIKGGGCSETCTPVNDQANHVHEKEGSHNGHVDDRTPSDFTSEGPRITKLLHEPTSNHDATPSTPKESLELCNALEKVLMSIDDGLEDIRVIYVQCVSHLLLAQFWCPLDPMHLFMSVRSFFVSLSSICRGFTRDLMKSSGSILLNGFKLIDNSTVAVSRPPMRSSYMLSTESDHIITDGEPSSYVSTPSGTSRHRSTSVTFHNREEQHATESVPRSHSNTASDSLDPSEVPRLDFSRSSDIHSNGSNSVVLPLGTMPTDITSPHYSKKSANEVKCDSETVWCNAWRTTLPMERVVVVKDDGGKVPDLRGRLSRSVSSEETSNVEQKGDRLYSIPLFVQHVFNVGVSVGFLGKFPPGSSDNDYSPHQLISGMHRGCSKHVQSVVALDYDTVYQMRRDLGNIISRALMSSDYLELCQSHFHTPTSGSLCQMGKCLLNYCKSKRYSLMTHLSAAPTRDDMFTLRVPQSTCSKDRRFGGLILNYLIFRYLRRYSKVSSIFQKNAYCIFSKDDLDNSGIYTLHRWDTLHSALLNNPWSSMASSMSDLQTVNLACTWQAAKIVTDYTDPTAKRSNDRVFCPVSQPSYGTPVILCSHRLLRYRWCLYNKDFNEMPVMDHYLKMLFTHVPNVRHILRTVIDGTVQNLMSTYIGRLSTHTMLAYADLQCDKLLTIDGCHGTQGGSVNGISHKCHPTIPDKGNHVTMGPSFSEDAVEGATAALRLRWNDLGTQTPDTLKGLMNAEIGSTFKMPNRLKSSFRDNGGSDMKWFRPPKDITSCQSITLNYVHGSYNIMVHFPEAFHMLRHLSCGDDISFARSLCRSSRLRCSGGKSGAFLSVSHDGKYMLKLLNRHEFQLFLERGDKFFSHLLSGGTSLSIPYGLFSVEHRRTGGVVRCLIMQNIEHVLGSTKLTFDLKGIAYKRYVNISPRNRSGDTSTFKEYSTVPSGSGVDHFQFPEHLVLLDQNFKDFTNGCPLHLEDNPLLQVFASVQRDLDFLSRLDVVDYSLLLRIFPEEGVIVLGIIDYLRPYTWDKQIETIGKKLANIASGQAPTIVSPLEYKTRFMAFFRRSFSLPIEEEKVVSVPTRVHKHVSRMAAGYKLRTSSFALDSLYTTPYVTSLYHYMWQTSPTAKLYIRQLMKSSMPCEDPEILMADMVRELRSTYQTPVIDQMYSSM